MRGVSGGEAPTEDDAGGKSTGDDSWTSARISVIVTAFILVSLLLYALSLYSYLLFHTVGELASIVIAVVIFVITWNARRFIHNNYLVFIGIAYLFIGGIDLVHMLSFPGMNVFTGYDTNLTNQLWIAARTLQALSLLVAPFMLHRKMNEKVVFAGYLVIFILLMLSIFAGNIFPTCYIEGQGQMPFKIGMEYVISGILVFSAYLLYRNRAFFDRSVITLLSLSLAATILSELAFTTYVSVFSFTAFLGHIFKILAFFCIYLAIIDTGFSRPYALIFRDLSQSRKEFSDLNARLEEKVKERTKELGRSNEELQASYEQLAATEEELRQQYSTLAEKDEAIHVLNRDLEKRVEDRTGELLQANEELSAAEEELREQLEELAKRDKLLSESEERFRISAQSVNDVIWDWNIPDGTRKWFGRIDEILGYAPGEFPRTIDAWEAVIHPEDRDRVMAMLDRHLKTQAPYATEYRVIRKDGEIRYWTDQGTAMLDDRGRAYRMVGSCSDITRRKRAEEVLHASEIRYRRLFEAAQDGILIVDAYNGQIVEVNPFLIAMLGFSREQLLGKKLWEIGLFKDIIANKDNFEELQRKEYIRYEDLPLVTADGRKISVEFISNVYDVNNKKVIQCNIRNISDRKQAEWALRQKNEELDGYFTNTLDLLFIADANGHFRRLSREWESALGYSPVELEGKHFLDLVHPDDREASLGAMAELKAGKKVLQFMNRYRHRDGSYRSIEWRLFPAGNLIYASARDVTERRKMTGLIEASLAEKETLLREIHHRVKNNLQIITSILNLQIRKLDDPKTIEVLRDSQNRVQSMALVHEHLYRGKDFSHINLKNYISALGNGLFQSYEADNRGIRLTLAMRDIYVDINTSIPLGLITNELITNSLKYAFSGKKDGIISITATEDSQTLTFVVADNGRGIPEEITLDNQTSSLGIRLVALLTSQLRGTVTIDRTKGAKFVFTFPKSAETAGKEESCL